MATITIPQVRNAPQSETLNTYGAPAKRGWAALGRGLQRAGGLLHAFEHLRQRAGMAGAAAKIEEASLSAVRETAAYLDEYPGLGEKDARAFARRQFDERCRSLSGGLTGRYKAAVDLQREDGAARAQIWAGDLARKSAISQARRRIRETADLFEKKGDMARAEAAMGEGLACGLFSQGQYEAYCARLPERAERRQAARMEDEDPAGLMEGLENGKFARLPEAERQSAWRRARAKRDTSQLLLARERLAQAVRDALPAEFSMGNLRSQNANGGQGAQARDFADGQEDLLQALQVGEYLAASPACGDACQSAHERFKQAQYVLESDLPDGQKLFFIDRLAAAADPSGVENTAAFQTGYARLLADYGERARACLAQGEEEAPPFARLMRDVEDLAEFCSAKPGADLGEVAAFVDGRRSWGGL